MQRNGHYFLYELKNANEGGTVKRYVRKCLEDSPKKAIKDNMEIKIRGVSADPKAKENDYGLVAAALVLLGDEKLARYLIKSKADINQQTRNEGTTALIFCAECLGQPNLITPGQALEFLKFLIAEKAGLNYQIQSGYTALRTALRYRHAEAIKILLDANADPNTGNDKLSSPLMIEAGRGEDEKHRASMLHLLLHHKAEVNAVSPDTFETALFEAIRVADLEAVKILIEAKADVNKFGKLNKETPFNRLEDCVFMMMRLAKGETIDDKEEYKKIETGKGLTALVPDSYQIKGKYKRPLWLMPDTEEKRISTLESYFAIGKLLLEHKAETDRSESDKKMTLLMQAANDKNNAAKESFVSFMINIGVQVDEANLQGDTALFFSAHKGGVKCMQALVGGKANVNHMNKRGATPLLFAAQGNQPEAVSFLLDNKADANLGGDFAPLHAAVSDIFVLKLLCEAKADVERRTKATGQTPLILAAKQGNICSLLYLLVVANANPLHHDKAGKTARHYARLSTSKHCPSIWHASWRNEKDYATLREMSVALLEAAENNERSKQWVKEIGENMPLVRFGY